MDRPIEKAEKASCLMKRAAVSVICVLAFVVMLYFSVQSLIVTCDMNLDNGMRENIDYRFDNVIWNLAAAAAGLVFFYFIRRPLQRVPAFWLELGLCVYVLAFGTVWVLSAQSAPTFDSFTVTDAAARAAAGDLSGIDSDYFRYYPFQLGYVLFSEGLIRLLGLSGNFLALEVLNVVFLAAAYMAILKCAALVSGNEEMVKLSAVLLAGCLPAVLFCTFLYGNIPGFAFAMLSVLAFLLFFKKNRWYHGVLSAVLLGISVCIKLNNLIFFVAMAIVTVVNLFRTKRELLLRAGYLILAAAMAVGLKSLPIAVYESRAGISLGDGIPMVSWLAMGLSESPIEDGWYSEDYTVGNFNENGRDPNAAAGDSLATIRERLSTFLQDPAYAIEFFFCKTASQWNEPSYQSLWTNEVRDHYAQPGALAEFVLGKGEYTVKGYMDLYQQFVFAGTALAAFFCFRRKELGISLFLLVLLGGFAYHLLFEAKSQYAMTYFVLMVPLAAYGFSLMMEKTDIWLSRRKEKKA